MLVEDFEQLFDGLERRELGLEDQVFREFDPDQRFRKAGLFHKVVVLLLASVHELRILACLFESFLDTVHVEDLVIVEFFFVTEIPCSVDVFLELLCLENSDFAILDGLGHELLSFFFELSKLLVEDD